MWKFFEIVHNVRSGFSVFAGTGIVERNFNILLEEDHYVDKADAFWFSSSMHSANLCFIAEVSQNIGVKS